MEPTFNYSTDPSNPVQIQYGDEFPSDLPAKTVLETLQNTVKQFPNKVAHRFNDNGEMKEITWVQYYNDVIEFAKGCVYMGVSPHSGVAIQGENNHLWLVANVGAIFARCVPTGVYPTNEPEDSRYVADLANSEIIVVQNETQLNKYFVNGKSASIHARCYVVWEKFSDEWENTDTKVYSMADFIENGKKVTDEELKARSVGLKASECCTIIPTSGTTGRPKGVMLSHDNITFMAANAARIFKLTEKDRELSYLPLSHIAGQMLDIYAPMTVGSKVTFAGPDALKGKLGDYLKEVRPTIFLGVPRVFEKIEEKMTGIGQQASKTKQKIVRFAKRKALENAQRKEMGQRPPPFYGLAKKLVLDKIPPLLGLDECRITATGAAPISHETMQYWKSLNFSLLNVYGMSESSGVISSNTPDHNKFGTAGKALPGTELILLPKDENGKQEIATRGRHVFMGYVGNEKATKETFTEDGFLRTGDYGELDDNGYLTVTGRKKELIVTSGGENVAPVPIENRFKEVMPMISNVMVIGDQKKFLSAVITLKTVPDEDMQPTQNLTDEIIKLFESQGSDAKTLEDASKDKQLLALFKEGLEEVNLGAVSKAQKVRKLMILPDDFKVSDKTLTPTMKLRRPVAQEKYADIIDKMYNV